MKVTIAMDSFKGSLTSLEAGNAVRTGILSACPSASVTVLPLADGGEGTIDAISPFVGGVRKSVTVRGPLGAPLESYYICSPSTGTAYIEMAKASGLTLISSSELDPYRASTYGTGELIRDALENGLKRLVICIGGSATNDGGAGMLTALGARFLDSSGRDIRPGAIGLKDLDHIDLSALMGLDADITVACDVTSPLCGPNGASHVYGPQKGATYEMAAAMDSWLKHYAEVAGFDPYEESTGAAGGMSFALKNFLGARLRSGADIVAEATGLESEIMASDIVITGEGRMDSQTLNGKAPFKVMQLGKKHGKTIFAISGILGDGYEECLRAGFDRIAPLIRPTMDREEAIRSAIDTAADLFNNMEKKQEV